MLLLIMCDALLLFLIIICDALIIPEKCKATLAAVGSLLLSHVAGRSTKLPVNQYDLLLITSASALRA